MSATATERPAELTFNRKPTVPRNASRPSPTMRYPVARAPLFWAAVAFAIGLYVGQYAWRPPVWWIVAACAHLCAGLYFLRLRPSLSRALTLIGFLFVGALAIQVRGGPELAQFEDAGEDPLEVTAHVTADGIPQSDGPGHVRQTLDLQADTLRSGSIMKTLPLGVRLNVFSKMESESPQETAPEPIMATDTAARIFHYGERIRFSTVLYRPRNFLNPGAFDYAGYLRDQGITATASIKAAEVERLQGFSGSRVAAAIALARSSIIEHIHSLWPEQTAALLDSMLIAEKSFIEQPTRTDFQRSGTYHMLIVAGLHVGVLAVFTMWLFRFLHCGRVLSDVLTLIVVLIYAALTQEGAPVWRATLMLAVYLITRSLYRHRAALNALGAAALALLVTKPNALMGASFEFSLCSAHRRRCHSASGADSRALCSRAA